MKIFLLFGMLAWIAGTKESCKKKAEDGIMVPAKNCYRGRLEVKAACMNYTISVLDAVDPSLVVADYTDNSTGKTYKNAFALGSRCNFPATLNAGDEFSFVIDSTVKQNCAVCMIYYPVPEKKLSIRVVDACQ